MNYIATPRQPFLALVDDDSHSARLLTRMLLAHGAPSVRWLDGISAADEELGAQLADPVAQLPGLVIVDLKASSDATHEFVARLSAHERAAELVIVAMASTLARDVRDNLIEAGAAAVFERHADLDAYRREAASIVSFWVRNQHLNAIGT
jgi:ActR/RegA family two-component response regulator